MDRELVRELSEAVGTAGREEAVRAVLRGYLAGRVDELQADAVGNLVARKGAGPLRVLLDGHMDEVGCTVSGYTDDGFIRFKKTGGVDDMALAGKLMWLGAGRVPGVVGVKAYHLTVDRDKAVPARELVLDVGCRTRAEAEALADYGEPIVWASRFEEWSPTVIKGKAFDDRLGAALVAEVVAGGPWQGLSVYGVLAAQEEVGLRGARVAAHRLNPHVALALDCTPANDTPGNDQAEVSTYLGQGPALYTVEGRGRVNPEGLLRHLQRLAGDHGVPWQPRRRAEGGTDAGAIALARAGVPVVSLSVPARYIHAGAALADRRDYDAALQLVRLFLDSLARGEFRP